jgi:hypothetical protein
VSLQDNPQAIIMVMAARPGVMCLLAAIGGARTKALQTGQVDATIFGSPQTEVQSTNNTQNLTLLASIPALFPGYQGSTYNVRPEVLKVGVALCLCTRVLRMQDPGQA